MQDRLFVGSIPEKYQRFLGPALFEPFAADIARRIAGRSITRVLEIAAGTGIVTRALRRALSHDIEIVATDLNPSMLSIAREFGPLENVRWLAADAADLPFERGEFDLVVCQFGLMFVPDKDRCASEVRRVLAPGGTFVFNVWDALEHNPVGIAIKETVDALYPMDPPRFFERGPYGYHDVETIRELLVRARFADVAFESIDARCHCPSARDLAIGMCEGSPLYNEIVERNPAGVAPLCDAVALAFGERFGFSPLDAPMRAHVFVAA